MDDPIEQLGKLLSNDNENIKWASHLAIHLQLQLSNGDISKEEYAELMADLKSNDKITSLVGTLEAKIQLEEALNALMSLASAV